MTLTRDDIADYLDSQFSSLAAAIGQSDSSDGAAGYGADIDLAYRRIGKSRSELATATVEDSQEQAILALAEYFAARRLWRHFGVFVTTKVDDSQFDYKQAQANVKTMMDNAKAECAALGYDVAASGWSSAYLNLDWLENEPAEVI
jgi:multidrug resistance efflux pump